MSNDIRDVMYSSHPPAQLGNAHVNIGTLTACVLAAVICPWPLYFLAYAIYTMWWPLIQCITHMCEGG
jgi:hypothetical protein